MVIIILKYFKQVASVKHSLLHIFCLILAVIFIHNNVLIVTAYSKETDSYAPLSYNDILAKYACLYDANANRMLWGKNADTPAPMASTTKIMTCIIALENCPLDYECTVSSYAASMPDVQMNITCGETFTLKDLLYGLMLKSYNDTAVAIAENVVTYIQKFSNNEINSLTATDKNNNISENDTETSKALVEEFAALMNKKAKELGCTDTYFITPNGLDASDEYGIHHTTAKELAIIMSYCINNEDFLKITSAPSYSFSSSKTSYSFNNANAFLNMYNNIISGKTGFTADAGYCYVCAYKSNGKTFVVSLLACGWPNNKNYKWKDSTKLLNYALQYYSPKLIISSNFTPIKTTVYEGTVDSTYITADIPTDLTLLTCENDDIKITSNIPKTLTAPLSANSSIGDICVFINDELFRKYNVICTCDVLKKSYNYTLKISLYKLLFIDKS